MKKYNPKESSDLISLYEQLDALIDSGFRFSLRHNPYEKTITITSVTDVDRLKHKFADFYIYLDGHNKVAERVFVY